MSESERKGNNNRKTTVFEQIVLKSYLTCGYNGRMQMQ